MTFATMRSTRRVISAAAEGQQHNSARVSAIDNEMRCAVRKRICLSQATESSFGGASL
jgi:hypothetical protein